MQNVLITGGAGFIGLALARALLQDGARVTLVDNFQRGRNDVELGQLRENPAVSFVELDLSVEGATDALGDGYDAIFHFAALLGVSNVIGQPFETLRLNTILTLEALRLAKRQAALRCFLFASTSEVYAGSLQAGLLSFPTPETSVLALPSLAAPRTSYMLSKLYGEALVLQAGVPAVIVRPHNVYGPRMGTEHVVPELMLRMTKAPSDGAIEIYSPDHMRTFCFIDDAVRLIAGLARRPEALGRAWNVGTQAPEHTMMAVAEKIRSVVRPGLELARGENTQGSPVRRCPDTSETDRLTGIVDRVPLEDGIARTFAWYRDNVFDRA
ncbi:MAG: NAD-binding protein [Enterovirga sp.]|nr:NAD-binding protein [Enterovirga sp.]